MIQTLRPRVQAFLRLQLRLIEPSPFVDNRNRPIRHDSSGMPPTAPFDGGCMQPRIPPGTPPVICIQLTERT